MFSQVVAPIVKVIISNGLGISENHFKSVQACIHRLLGRVIFKILPVCQLISVKKDFVAFRIS